MTGGIQDDGGLDQDKDLIIMVRYILEGIVISGSNATYSVPIPCLDPYTTILQETSLRIR